MYLGVCIHVTDHEPVNYTVEYIQSSCSTLPLFRECCSEPGKKSLVARLCALQIVLVGRKLHSYWLLKRGSGIAKLKGASLWGVASGWELVLFPDDVSLSGGKIRLVVCLFHFGSGAPDCWRIVNSWCNAGVHCEIPQWLSRRTWISTRQFELLVWASLCVPTGRGKSLCYAIFSYVQTTSNRDLKDCFLHLRFELNSAIKQDEASLVHIARRNALSWDSFTTSRVGKTNLYQNLHVHGLWTRQHKISIPFTWSKVIPNSENQNGIGRFPDLSSPLAEWKVWLARLGGNHVALVWGWKDTPLDLSFYLWGSLAFASQIF